MNFVELLKVIFIGIVEGITEWLPISSTGHMILVDEFLKLNVTEEFMNMFLVLIQLGAILAVVVLYFKKIMPIWIEKKKDKAKLVVKKDVIEMWLKVLVACVPAGIIGFLFDDFLDAHLHTPFVVSLMLIIYGILFIIVEARNKGKQAKIKTIKDLTFKTALIIGAFQVLSLIPGTSRSGATILGAILIGVDRETAAEFTFFLAIPVMFGASLLKIIKFGFAFTSTEILVLLVGMLSAFIVSVLAIKFLISYIKKNDFTIFGWYRIALGIIVLVTFMFI